MSRPTREYATAQRELLLGYFEKHSEMQFSVDQLHEALKGSEPAISMSAIYRNVARMAEEGILQKLALEDSRKAVYQYLPEYECAEHLHLKCESCGKLIHMDEESLQALSKLAQEAQFEIDGKKSILYGSCKDCPHEK